MVSDQQVDLIIRVYFRTGGLLVGCYFASKVFLLRDEGLGLIKGSLRTWVGVREFMESSATLSHSLL